ncbi:hypothetical protein A0H81_01969 [Grifola frondosa]|uniref:Uncharacterized protein n=1 Tax=Grifola frondosa TaxID=5627 RepID=A0A1C7MMW3_GRIFR|nr:hypothetical protein A0H81_01969 [Grifola frondosa]
MACRAGYPESTEFLGQVLLPVDLMHRPLWNSPERRSRSISTSTSSTPANRQTTADFLVAVTDLYAHITCSGFEAHAPRTALEFAEYFKRSDVVRLNCEDMATYTEAFVGKPVRAHEFKKSAKAERAKHSNKKSPVIVSIPMQARMLMDCCAGHPARVVRCAGYHYGHCFLRLPEQLSNSSLVQGAWQPPSRAWCPHGLTDSENDGDDDGDK